MSSASSVCSHHHSNSVSSMSSYSSREDLASSSDSLDLLGVDNVEEEDMQQVMYRLLMEVEKLKKRAKFFKKNYERMETKNETLSRANNSLQGQLMKAQCDNDRMCKENQKLKDKLRKLQNIRFAPILDKHPCAVISEEDVHV